jgi:hypothetical protein
VYIVTILQRKYSNATPSNATPQSFNEMMCGYGSLQINGNHALLSIQQTPR